MAELAGHALLDLLNAESTAWLAALGTRRRYADGETIHIRGDPNPTMCIVIAGCVRVVRQRADGSHSFVSLITPGQHFADVLMLPDRAARTHDVLAAGDVTIDHYDQAAFAQLLDRPEILRALYRITAGRLVGAMSMLDDLRSLPPEAHLAKLLLHMRPRDGAATIPCRQEDLAALLGISPMTLAKSLALLKREGLVETGYRRISLPDPVRLRGWVARRLAE